MGKFFFSRIKQIEGEEFPYAMGINFREVREQKEFVLLFNKLQRNQIEIDLIKKGFELKEERGKMEKEWFDNYNKEVMK